MKPRSAVLDRRSLEALVGRSKAISRVVGASTALRYLVLSVSFLSIAAWRRASSGPSAGERAPRDPRRAASRPASRFRLPTKAAAVSYLERIVAGFSPGVLVAATYVLSDELTTFTNRTAALAEEPVAVTVMS